MVKYWSEQLMMCSKENIFSWLQVHRQHSQILQVVIFACIVVAVVPYQPDISNNQIVEMLAQLDEEQRAMRSEIEEIQKSTRNRNFEEQDPGQQHATQTKRAVQANCSNGK